MKELVEKIGAEALSSIAAAENPAVVEDLRVRFLGKKGELTAVLKQLGSLPGSERPLIGALVNDMRKGIEEALLSRKARLLQAVTDARLLAETIDVTLPGTDPVIGKLHPLTKVLAEITEIFLGMGFDVAEGPEVEYDRYCFEMLNIPKGHPARDTQDTFYINDNVLLRTQTSSVQVRVMLAQGPPIRIISPGRVYRVDTVDATHSPTFHQIEGLVVDKGVTMADLKGTLQSVAQSLYGDDISVRFRPHHFPYTEPSAEMDATCFLCRGEGCALCKGEGFIELLGCGMVHPKVLSRCGIDPLVYSGYAFGMGLDRITMMRYGIRDLRLLFENDLRFLDQF